MRTAAYWLLAISVTMLALVEIVGFFVRRYVRRVARDHEEAEMNLRFWRTIWHGYRRP